MAQDIALHYTYPLKYVEEVLLNKIKATREELELCHESNMIWKVSRFSITKCYFILKKQRGGVYANGWHFGIEKNIVNALCFFSRR